MLLKSSIIQTLTFNFTMTRLLIGLTKFWRKITTPIFWSSLFLILKGVIWRYCACGELPPTFLLNNSCCERALLTHHKISQKYFSPITWFFNVDSQNISKLNENMHSRNASQIYAMHIVGNWDFGKFIHPPLLAWTASESVHYGNRCQHWSQLVASAASHGPDFKICPDHEIYLLKLLNVFVW